MLFVLIVKIRKVSILNNCLHIQYLINAYGYLEKPGSMLAFGKADDLAFKRIHEYTMGIRRNSVFAEFSCH